MIKKLLATAPAVAILACALFAFNPGAVRAIKREAVVTIAGDVMLDRGVAAEVAKKGESYPLSGFSDIFSKDDLSIANLECALTEEGEAANKEFVFKAGRESASVMKSSGLDALMLANNHTLDYLGKGISDTMDALDKVGLLHAGAGKSGEETKPVFTEKNGVRIGILSYSEFPPEGGDFGGMSIAYVPEGSLDKMREEIKKAASQCDFLIVYYHWGIEYQNYVSKHQKEIAHAAAESGASFVVGTHPHVLQGRETFKGVPIYYSLGNFVFDRQFQRGTDESLVLQLTVSKDGEVSVKEIPAVILSGRPEPAKGEVATRIIAELERFSEWIAD